MAWHPTWNEPTDDRPRPRFMADRGGMMPPGVKVILLLTVGVFLADGFTNGALSRFGALTVTDVLHLQVHIQGRRALFGVGVQSWREHLRPGQLGGVLCYCIGRIMAVNAEDTLALFDASSQARQTMAAAYVPRLLLSLNPIQARPARAGAVAPDGVCCGPAALPLRPGGLDCLIGAFPAAEAIGAELVAALQPGGVACVVTADAPAWRSAIAAAQLPLDILAALPIQARGRSRVIVVLERLPGPPPADDLLEIEPVARTGRSQGRPP